jgi:hypothetical protein
MVRLNWACSVFSIPAIIMEMGDKMDPLDATVRETLALTNLRQPMQFDFD